ncbi:hypothetical protein V6N12_034111 [Hibiscus sabdariffa]|uniref:Uncharacterized protein n=1 Tax=Hibiscus sabdariffa TaxID=183260 RepID=A0ABR2BGT8_9ROSI
MGGLIVRREGLDYCSNKACQTGLSLYGQRHCLLAIASSLPVSSISITIKILTQQMSVGLSYPGRFCLPYTSSLPYIDMEVGMDKTHLHYHLAVRIRILSPESLTPVEVFCSHVALVLENS